MNIKRYLRYLWPFAVFLFLCAIAPLFRQAPDPFITIGILQSDSHPILDECCHAFVERIESQLGKHIQFLNLNAKGSLKTTRSHARKLHNSSKVKAIFTLGPLATKVMAQIEDHKPLFFAAISASEMPTFSKSNTNIKGLESLFDPELMIFTRNLIAPESKSATVIREEKTLSNPRYSLKERLERQGMTVTEITLTPKTDLTNLATTSLANDIIFLDISSINNSNQFSSLIEKSFLSKRPLITTDPSLLQEGACACCSIDYKETGVRAAEMLISELSPDSVPKNTKDSLSPPKIVFNHTVLQAWNLTLPDHDDTSSPPFICKEYPQTLQEIIPQKDS